MRSHTLCLPIMLGLCLGLATSPARAADIDLKATWKLVVLAQLRENDLFLIDVHERDGKLDASISGPGQFPEPPKASGLASKDGIVTVNINIGGTELVFRGKPSSPSIVLGAMKVNDQLIPCRLEKTDLERLEQPAQALSPVVRDFITARNEQLPRTRVRLLRAVIEQKPGDPSLAPVYMEVVRDADAAELTEDDVRKIVTQWIEGARPYGDEFATEIQTKAVLTLAGKAAYAQLTLKLAREADAVLEASKGSLQTRAEVARALAAAAKVAGDNALASTATAKSVRLETELDEAYHKTVPPFKPDASAGPKSRASDRVVLLELFTGAECPPCVGADVAFDALNVSYKPTQLVTLQYHLHVPGPDPLANPDSLARSEYYPDLQGTPTLYFDGKSHELPGGRMSDSKDRYDMDRKIIDEALTAPSRAAITLKVSRKGDTVTINTSAQAKQKGSRLKLRLALIEEAVRYVGGNGLRFHHHVVRALPGGAEGKALADGKGTSEVTIDLAKLRKDLDRYLADYVKDGNSFRKALPPIALENLSVVAIVQDDEDRSVLNAIIAPVGKAE